MVAGPAVHLLLPVPGKHTISGGSRNTSFVAAACTGYRAAAGSRTSCSCIIIVNKYTYMTYDGDDNDNMRIVRTITCTWEGKVLGAE